MHPQRPRATGALMLIVGFAEGTEALDEPPNEMKEATANTPTRAIFLSM
jgi:hypothetical protein